MNTRSKKTILIVSPAPEQRETLKSMLLRAGYVVLTAADAGQGYKIAQQKELDLIIGEAVPPVRDELLHLIRTDERLRALPFLLVGDALARDGRRAG